MTTQPATRLLVCNRGAPIFLAEALMSLRKLRKQCEEQLADMPMPDPFSIPALVRALEKRRRRRIFLLPMPDNVLNPDAACGLWAKHPVADIVLFVRGTTPYHQDHIILHELSHLWWEHGNALTPEQMQRLLPHLGTKLITKFIGQVPVMGRTTHTGLEEQQAEMTAEIIHQRARELTGHSSDMLSRLSKSLSHPVAKRRKSRGVK